MAVNKFDKTYALFQKGDVLVDMTSNPTFAVKVLKEVYVDQVGEYLLILQYGSVRSGKWVGDKRSNDTADLFLQSQKQLRSGFVGTWTEDKFSVSPGDILKDKDGVIYVVQSESQIWNTKTGTHAGLAYWNGTDYGQENKQFSQVKSANGSLFSKHLKVG